MRAYLWITGVLFALMAALHLFIAWQHGFGASGNLANAAAPAAVLVVCGVLAAWAFRLLRRAGPGA
jgi:hypothetical protein